MTKEEMREAYRTAAEPVLFVGRRPSGTIFGTWVNYSDDATEVLPEAHPEVVAFREAPAVRTAAIGSAHALEQRRADALGKSDDIADQIEALKIRIKLVGG